MPESVKPVKPATKEEGYYCYESDRDVSTAIYRNGHAMTMGQIRDRLALAESLVRELCDAGEGLCGPADSARPEDHCAACKLKAVITRARAELET